MMCWLGNTAPACESVKRKTQQETKATESFLFLLGFVYDDMAVVTAEIEKQYLIHKMGKERKNFLH